jgi:hypothetical protein
MLSRESILRRRQAILAAAPPPPAHMMARRLGYNRDGDLVARESFADAAARTTWGPRTPITGL